MRGREYRAVDRPGALPSSPDLEAALCSCSEIPARLGHGAGEDGVQVAHATRKRTVRAAQADPGTGIRHHQIGDGLSPMPAARAEKRQRRVEFGDDELEHQANVRDAGLLRRHRDLSVLQYRSKSTWFSALYPFFRSIKTSIRQAARGRLFDHRVLPSLPTVHR